MGENKSFPPFFCVLKNAKNEPKSDNFLQKKTEKISDFFAIIFFKKTTIPHLHGGGSDNIQF